MNKDNPEQTSPSFEINNDASNYGAQGIFYGPVSFTMPKEHLVGKPLPSPSADKLREQHNQDIWERYLNDLIKELQASRDILGYVRLSGKAAFSSHAQGVWPKEFEDFHLVYRELKGKLRREHNEVQWQNIDYEVLADIDDAVNKFPCFVLVGEPGAGKTTTLRHLAVEAAKKSVARIDKAPKPLFLYLPKCNWDNVLSFEDFIRVNLPTGDDPKTILAQREISLYLDGLNEMGADGPRKAKLLHRWLHGPTLLPKIVITCRIRDYIDEFDLDIPIVLIQEMNPQQIHQFATNYLGCNAEPFLKQIQFEQPTMDGGDHSISQLARNPFLLSILIRVYESLPNRALPRNHGMLFQALIRFLWNLEEKKGTPGWIPFERMETFFSHLAFAMIDENKPVDVPIAYALEHVRQQSLVLQAGHNAKILRIDEQQKQVRFYHQLIQEYFAGVRLGKVGLQKKLEYREFDDDWDLHPNFQKWGQAIIAYCGMLENADAIIDQLLEKDVFLAAYCLDTGIAVSDKMRRKTTQCLLTGLRTVVNATANPSLRTRRRRSFLHALSKTNESLAAEELVRYLANDSDYILRNDAATGLIKMNPNLSLHALKEALDNMSEGQPDNSFYETISTVAVIRDVRAILMLLSLLGSENHYKRFHAMHWLASLEKSPLFLEGLHLAMKDVNGFVREYAARKLADLEE